MGLTITISPAANRLMEQKNYEDVWKYVLPQAYAGDSNTQCLVALCLVALFYHCGLGVAPDLAEAERWLRKAADQNNPLAWNNLGSLYAAGIPELKCRWGGVRSRYEKAKELGFNVGRFRSFATLFRPANG